MNWYTLIKQAQYNLSGNGAWLDKWGNVALADDHVPMMYNLLTSIHGFNATDKIQYEDAYKLGYVKLTFDGSRLGVEGGSIQDLTGRQQDVLSNMFAQVKTKTRSDPIAYDITTTKGFSEGTCWLDFDDYKGDVVTVEQLKAAFTGQHPATPAENQI